MHLDDLANELFLEIFQYLSTFDLLRSFYDLNHRINQLLFAHFRTAVIDFGSTSLDDFRLVCRDYFPSFVNCVTSLRLSNDDETPQQMEVFLEHGLALPQLLNLRSLTLHNIRSNSNVLHTMISECRSLPRLTRLTLSDCYLPGDRMNTPTFFNNIWSLSNLIYCYLSIGFTSGGFVLPTVKSTSLKSLFVPYVKFDQIEFSMICQQTPSLEQFDSSFKLKFSDQVVSSTHQCASIV
ncbi:unnamed protein product, partial [Adineta ricciae]